MCRIDRRTFSKCIAFEDISYQLAQPETRTAIFEHLCDLYNYVDASIHVQLSFLNRKVDPVQYAKSFEIAPQGDDFDDIRAEYTAILQKQLASGNNGIVKTKYLTFTIEADSLKTARARLTRIGLDLLGYFKTMGCVAHVMDGQERLEVLHDIFHPDGEPFRFDWDWLAPSGLSTKDFVAPSSLCFGTAKTFGLGGKYGAVSFLQILAPELSDEMLADFLKTESGILVNLHVQAIDQTEAIKTIKRKITDLDAMKIQEQKKGCPFRVRHGYPPQRPCHLRRGCQKAAEQIADPERTAFHADLSGAERGRHQAKSWATMCSKPQVWHRSTTARSSGWTTSRSRALCPAFRWVSTR